MKLLTNYKSLDNAHPVKKVGIAYSKAERQYFATDDAYFSEAEVAGRAHKVAEYLVNRDLKVKLYPGDETLLTKIKRDRPDLVFNLVDSVYGDETLTACIPSIMELAKIPYTGSGILGLSISANKYLCKKLLEAGNIPVPVFQLFMTAGDTINPRLKFPVISKLNESHGSLEISEEAISEDEESLRRRVQKLMSTYKQPVLVEQFVGSREVSAYVVGGLQQKVYLVERVFDANFQKGPHKICSFENVWKDQSLEKYQKYSSDDLCSLVKSAFEILKMEDYGKFDIRIDDGGHHYFIDCNHNNSFGPDEPMTHALALYDVTFDDVVDRLLARNVKEIKEEILEEQATFAKNLEGARVTSIL